MNISAKWEYENSRKYQAKLISVEYCCEDLKISNCVKFGEFDGMLNRNTDVNIAFFYNYPEGGFYEEEKINFCPFCGEKIEVFIK